MLTVMACLPAWIGLIAADSVKVPVHAIPELETTQLNVDGHLDEPFWQNALKLELGYEVRPGENIDPPVRTELLLVYDQDRIIIGYRAHDPNPEEIRARYRDRDSAWADDFVGVVFDTFNDERRAYEFMCNPLGVQTDAINDDVGGSYDTSWNAIWDSGGRLTDTGYEVEMVIPFNQLRFQEVDGEQVWGIDGFRSYPRRHRHHIGLFPRQRGANTYLAQTEKMRGFNNIKPGKNIELVPTFTSVRNDERSDFPDGGFEKVDDANELGLTARWGITPDMTLSGAVNPDFSQVEADAVQLDINETFALFFDETRPFFLESADYFQTRMNQLYTRNIADPDTALKFTAKRNNHTFGFMAAEDAGTTVLLPGAQGSQTERFEMDSQAWIGRYRYEIGEGYTVGSMLTMREGSEYHNRVLSVDANLRFSRNDILILNASGSQTQYNQEMAETFEIDQEEIEDYGFRAFYRHQERNWNATLSYDDYGNDYRTDLGFNPQVGTNKKLVGANYLWWGDHERWYRQLVLGGDIDETMEEDGSLLEREYEMWFEVYGPLESRIVASAGTRDRVYNDVTFDQVYGAIGGEIRFNQNLYLDVLGSWGDWIDFEETRPAKRTEYEVETSISLGRRFYVDLSYEYARLDLDEGELFTAHVPQSRWVYQHNQRIRLRAQVFYTQIERNEALYTEEVEKESEDLFTQVLFSYKLNPQTVAYLGYSDSSEGVLDDEQTYDLTRKDRTFFVKFGYAWTR